MYFIFFSDKLILSSNKNKFIIINFDLLRFCSRECLMYGCNLLLFVRVIGIEIKVFLNVLIVYCI